MTLSQIWLSWNLPIFLLSVGLLTLIKIASLINLVRSWPSLPRILKLWGVIWCPVSCLCSWNGDGSLRFSLHCSPMGPWCFFNIFTPTVNRWALVMVNYSTFLFLWILVLGLNQKLFGSPISFEVGLYTILAAYVFDTSPRHWTYGMTICPTLGLPLGGSGCWLLLLLVLVTCVVVPTWLLLLLAPPSQLPFIILFCTLLMAHLEYLHLPRASLRCCNSSVRSSGRSAYHLGPMGKCTYDTVLSRKIVMTIPLSSSQCEGVCCTPLY